jgi:hypothetical protein
MNSVNTSKFTEEKFPNSNSLSCPATINDPYTEIIKIKVKKNNSIINSQMFILILNILKNFLNSDATDPDI